MTIGLRNNVMYSNEWEGVWVITSCTQGSNNYNYNYNYAVVIEGQ